MLKESFGYREASETPGVKTHGENERSPSGAMFCQPELAKYMEDEV
jgi:hypothetical protein